MNDTIFFSLYSLAHQSTFLDWLIIFCANSFGYIMVFVAFLYLIFHEDGVFNYRVPFLQFKNKSKEVLLVFSASMSAWILATVAKSFIFAPRPFMLFENVRNYIEKTDKLPFNSHSYDEKEIEILEKIPMSFLG